jgi:hypothetical protein
LHLIAYAYGLSAVACLLFADEMAAGMGIFLMASTATASSTPPTASGRHRARRCSQHGRANRPSTAISLQCWSWRSRRPVVFGHQLRLAQGFVLFMCAMELLAGLALLLLRPAR